MKLLVDKDFGSESIWVPTESGTDWGNGDHHGLGLPQDLVDRLDYMSDWFEKFEPFSLTPEIDFRAYEAYKLALAIDLKRYFGDKAQIFTWLNDKYVVEITGDDFKMTRRTKKKECRGLNTIA